METAIAFAVGIPVMFFGPALVWATVIAGLYQIIRDKASTRGPVRAKSSSVA